jgi:hypothetical protein
MFSEQCYNVTLAPELVPCTWGLCSNGTQNNIHKKKSSSGQFLYLVHVAKKLYDTDSSVQITGIRR